MLLCILHFTLLLLGFSGFEPVLGTKREQVLNRFFYVYN